MKQNKKLSNFILELFVEEIPARLVNDLSEQLHNNFKNSLKDKSVPYKSIAHFSTPRRLIIAIEGLDKKQKNIEKYLVGPPKKISIDEKGVFLKPGIAFIEKNNLDRDDIEIVKKESGEFIGANVKIIGKDTTELLKEITSESINKIKNKKFMKWGSGSFQFIRPIKNIFLLFDSKFLKINFNEINNENKILGHRFFNNKGKKILSYNEYFEFMKRSYVEISFEERKKSIHKQIATIEKKLGINVPIDEDLLNHVANLTEFPNVLIGNFDKDFLTTPKEVNISVMKNHQKYFPVFKDKKLKKLDSKFIFVAGSPFLDKKTVISGNEKVIRARLDDAKFFFNEDMNLGLATIQKKLEFTTFIAGAGSYQNKSERILLLSQELTKLLDITSQVNKKELVDISNLIKADLSSQMVYEFPELQGIMGKYYYKKTDKNIAEIIEQHYLPKSRNDALPTNNLAKIISIADKLDTITSCFSLGLIPTGSSDPYGLRRNSIGIIRIAESLQKNLDLINLVNLSIDCFQKNSNKKVGEDSRINAIEFFIDRIKNYLLDMGYQTNIINSILNIDSPYIDIDSLKKKANLISEFKRNKNLDVAIGVDKRLKNIVKNNEEIEIDTNLLTDPNEQKLHKKFLSIKSFFTSDCMQNSPASTLNSIIETSPALEAFFENVLVMDKNIKVKENRVNLLTNIKNLISRFINLSEI